MRRKDREITDIAEIKNIIDGCKVCHLAMSDGDTPYVVPMNFGYELEKESLTLYFHCAFEGRKLDILKKNPCVCFEMCREDERVFSEKNLCGSGCYYASVIGNGRAAAVTDTEEKKKALSLLMRHVLDAEAVFTKEQADSVCVIKITVLDVTAKKKAERKGEEDGIPV